MPRKFFTQELIGDEKKGQTQGKMERGSRKRSSRAGSEKMDRVGSRQEKMEGHCSTGQSPQWAVVSMEEKKKKLLTEEKILQTLVLSVIYLQVLRHFYVSVIAACVVLLRHNNE